MIGGLSQIDVVSQGGIDGVSDWDANAAYITLLTEMLAKLRDELHDIKHEYGRLSGAYHYMQRIIEIIRDNPVLLDEWRNLLESIGIAEPDWKQQYDV